MPNGSKEQFSPIIEQQPGVTEYKQAPKLLYKSLDLIIFSII